MITLKNGFEVEYDEDFDAFFKKLLDSVINESKKSAEKKSETPDGESARDMFLKELMDNCILVTHQIFELSQKNEELSKFIVTGFLFNSAVLCLADSSESPETEKNPDTLH